MGFKPRKNVKKLAEGGQTGNPFLGVGIQYQQIAPDVPSLDAAKIVYDNYRQNQEYLEQERAKRKPSREALMQRISQYKGTTGGKAALADAITGQLDEYEKNIKAGDMDWVFSQEATDQFSNLISASLDPSRIQELENNFNTLTSGYDFLIKNNTLENAQVSNGRILVRNKETGNTEEIPLESAREDMHEVITGKRRYEELFNARNFDASRDSFFTGVINYDNAINNLLESFRTAGGSDAVNYGSQPTQGDVQAVVDNRRALEAAKTQAKKNMSNETRSTLQGEYWNRIKSTGAAYTEAGFNAFVDGILNLQVSKMRDRKTEYRQYDDTGSGSGKEPEITSSDYSGVIREDFSVPFTDTEGWDERGSLRIVGSSYVQGDKGPVERLNISGPVYSVGGEDGIFKNTNYTAENGGRSHVVELELENVYHDGAFLMPVTTGSVYDLNRKKISDSKEDAGRLVMEGNGNDFKFAGSYLAPGTPMESMTIDVMGEDGQVAYQRTINVMRLQGDKYIEVKASPFDMYTKKDDRSWFSGGTNAKIMVPMSQDRSVVAFNANISQQRQDQEYFTGPNKSWPADPDAPGNRALEKIRKGNQRLYDYTVAQIALARANAAGDPERYRQEANRRLNEAMNEITEAAIRSNISVAKPDYTRTQNNASRQ